MSIQRAREMCNRTYPSQSLVLAKSPNCHDKPGSSQEQVASNSLCRIRHERSAVAKSYQQQASLDLKNFLQATAVELVPGALLFIICLATQALEPNQFVDDGISAYCEDLTEVFSDLVAEGILTEEQCDKFNFSMYLRSVEDVKEGVASCGDFDIMTATVNKTERSAAEVFATSDAEALSKKIVGMFRGAIITAKEAHFGKEITEVIWQRFEKVYEKKIVESED